MTTLSTLLKGLAIGFSIAAPVGPIGVLCIRTTLVRGRIAGLCAGLGAAVADGCYGLVAAGGLTAVLHALVALDVPLRLLGGAFLVFLGLSALRASPPGESAPPPATGLARVFITTFLLTLSNPMTILSFVALLGAVGASAAGGPFALVAGVFLGSALWWLTLSLLVGLFRARVAPRVMRGVNVGAGALIAGFGAWVLVGLSRG